LTPATPSISASEAPSPRHEIWLVCGSRELENEDWVFRTLTALAHRYGWPETVFHGAARGADALAGRWAEMYLRDPRHVRQRQFLADWDRHGKKAGVLRNQEMADALKATGKKALCVALPVVGLPNTGTFDMVARAGRTGVPVYVIPCHHPQRVEPALPGMR
jgi:hypothetical protein